MITLAASDLFDQSQGYAKTEVCSAEIGVGLTAFGLLFTVRGVLFFFDRGLLAMGNVSLNILRWCA